MDEIISYKMCAVKVRNAKMRNYLKVTPYNLKIEENHELDQTFWKNVTCLK
jgi:hypothetical protein